MTDTTAAAAIDAIRADDRRCAGGAVGTGFTPLDEVLHGGLRPGDLLLLGGKPGQGKTVAALQWARGVAASGRRALFASFEHDTTTLVTRLLALELGEVSQRQGCDDQLRLEALRERLRSLHVGEERAATVLGSDDLLVQAEQQVRAYGSRLTLVAASGARTDLAALDHLLERAPEREAVLFVDYLQKVPVRPDPAEEAERVTRVAEGLKELALRRGVAVIAVVAANQAGVASRRVHLHHLRGSTALAYEADVAVILNDKLSIVSRLHLAYDPTRAHDFRERVVFSVEKNRGGLADVHLEFRKDFAHYRFHPQGGWVAERLWEEGSVEE